MVTPGIFILVFQRTVIQRYERLTTVQLPEMVGVGQYFCIEIKQALTLSFKNTQSKENTRLIFPSHFPFLISGLHTMPTGPVIVFPCLLFSAKENPVLSFHPFSR
jgi:hypothetical protein